jgi:hypothetical protein
MKYIFSASAAVALLGIAFSGAATAQNPEELNTRPGAAPTPLNITPGSAQPTRGVVFFTAAINSDGSVASCFQCNTTKTIRVAVGRYIVDFGQNVQAISASNQWLEPMGSA